MMKAVQKVVLEEGNGGEDQRDRRKWYDGGGSGGDCVQVDLADSALKAVRDGSVIATVESCYSNLQGSKKRSSKTKQPVRITML